MNTVKPQAALFPSELLSDEALRFVAPHALATTEECAYVMSRLDRIIGDIDDQLSRAKAKARTEAHFAEPDWFVSAKRALKTAKSTRTAVQERKGELSRAAHRAFQRELAQRFIDVARSTLPADTFRTIMDQARNSSAEVA